MFRVTAQVMGLLLLPSLLSAAPEASFAEGLEPEVEHTLEILPLFEGESEQELRLESVCVAGTGSVRADLQTAPADFVGRHP